jgi:hypothetical protein
VTKVLSCIPLRIKEQTRDSLFSTKRAKNQSHECEVSTYRVGVTHKLFRLCRRLLSFIHMTIFDRRWVVFPSRIESRRETYQNGSRNRTTSIKAHSNVPFWCDLRAFSAPRTPSPSATLLTKLLVKGGLCFPPKSKADAKLIVPTNRVQKQNHNFQAFFSTYRFGVTHERFRLRRRLCSLPHFDGVVTAAGRHTLIVHRESGDPPEMARERATCTHRAVGLVAHCGVDLPEPDLREEGFRVLGF